MANVPVKDTPMSSGAPTSAPSQTEAITATGPVGQGSDSHPTPPVRVPPPAAKGSTGPQIAAPSVDYNTQQGNRIPADVLHHTQTPTPLGQQDQRT